MFDIGENKHKTLNKERITLWFVLIKIKGSWKWLNVEKKQKKVRKKVRKKEEDKLNLFWGIAPPC